MPYVKITNFAVKDALSSGDPLKIVRGEEIDDEFNALATATDLFLAKDGSVLPTADLPMNAKKLTGLAPGTARTDAASLATIQDGTGVYVGTVGGTADVITLTPSPAITSYTAGKRFTFIASGTNTTNVTVAVSGLAARSVTKNGSTALVAGDIPSGSLVTINDDGTRFQVVTITRSLAAAGANADITSMTALTAPTVATNPVRVSDLQSQTLQSFTTGGTSTAYTLTPTPALGSLTTGHRFNVVFNATAGVAPTLAISGLTAKLLKVYDSNGAKVAASATTIVANMISDVEYDGTDYVVLDPIRPASGITLGTSQASTSGTSIDFNSLPAGLKRIVISFVGVSGNGTSIPMIQLGDAGGVENTGYLGSASTTSAGATGTAFFSAGLVLCQSSAAASLYHGAISLFLVDSATNTWAASWSLGLGNASTNHWGGGSKPLSAVLDRVRVTFVNGTDVFDAGLINIQYE